MTCVFSHYENQSRLLLLQKRYLQVFKFITERSICISFGSCSRMGRGNSNWSTGEILGNSLHWKYLNIELLISSWCSHLVNVICLVDGWINRKSTSFWYQISNWQQHRREFSHRKILYLFRLHVISELTALDIHFKLWYECCTINVEFF